MSDEDYGIDYSFDLPTDIRGKNTTQWGLFKAPFYDKEQKKTVYASKWFVPDATGDDNASKLKNRLDQSYRTYAKKFVDIKGEPLLDEKENPVVVPKFIARVLLENEVSGVRIWRME